MLDFVLTLRDLFRAFYEGMYRFLKYFRYDMNYEIRDMAHLTFHKCCLLRRTILILRYTYEPYECTTSKHSQINSVVLYL